MGSDWRDVRFEDVVELQSGFAFKSKDFLDEGELRLARGANIGQGSFNWSDTKYLPSDHRDIDDRHRLASGDVLLAMDRPWIAAGLKYAVVRPGDLPALLVQRVARLRARAGQLDQGFLYYLLGSPAFTDYVRSVETGTTIPHISGKQIQGYRVSIPPIEEQRAIAEVLGALDDRSTYLGERVRLAHATILSWYDSLGTSSFPSAPLGSVIDVVGGSTPSTKQPIYWGGEHCWVTPKDLSEQQSPVVLRSTRKLTDAGASKISSGLLPEGTVLLSSRAPIGYVAVARVPLAVNQGFIALPPSDVACPAYLVGWLHRSMQLIKGRAGGSTFAEISKRNFKPIEFPVPGGPAYEQFRRGADELYDLIADAERERQTTAELRAVLLPRLLSGEMRIEDPARVLGAVA